MRTGREVSVFVHRGEQVLLLRRARDGMWHIPAGGVDAGESTHDAARRELAEEAGLRASALDVLGYVCRYPIPADDRRTYPPGVVDIEHEVFAVPAPSGWEPRLDAEHTEHRWASFGEARGIFHWDDTRAAFDILRGRLAEVQRGG